MKLGEFPLDLDHLMYSIDLLHAEAEMLQEEDHQEQQSAQYLAKCLQSTNVWHITTNHANHYTTKAHYV